MDPKRKRERMGWEGDRMRRKGEINVVHQNLLGSTCKDHKFIV